VREACNLKLTLMQLPDFNYFLILQETMYMAATASLEELQAAYQNLNELKAKHPEAYVEFAGLFKNHRKIGYKNICKMLLGEATPEKLKEEK
jgi:hypothetical protein